MRNKVTIISGPRGSGKTTLAQKIANGKKTVWIQNFDINNQFIYQNVEKDTEVIIAEEITAIYLIMCIISTDKIRVNKKMKEPFFMKRPEFIFVTKESVDLGLLLPDHVEFISTSLTSLSVNEDKHSLSERCVIKLDHNFHVYIHGENDKASIESDSKGKYMKLYYDQIRD